MTECPFSLKVVKLVENVVDCVVLEIEIDHGH